VIGQYAYDRGAWLPQGPAVTYPDADAWYRDEVDGSFCMKCRSISGHAPKEIFLLPSLFLGVPYEHYL